MLKKVLIGVFALVMLSGFVAGIYLVGREVFDGPQVARAAGGRYTEESGRNAEVEVAQGRGRALAQDEHADEDCGSEKGNEGSQGRGQGGGQVEQPRGGGQSEQAVGQGQGRGRESAQASGPQGQGQGIGRSGEAQGGTPQQDGQGRGQGSGQGNTPIEHDVNWQEITGTVSEYDHEMLLDTAAGEVLVGMGQSTYVEAQGFSAKVGDQVKVSGFHEDGEFKAGVVENLTTGASITLRDETGRPMWAGNGEGKNRS